MEWGEKEEFLEGIEKETGITPPALLKKPELEFWMAGYLKAFWILCARRTVGMSPNPISFTDIALYFEKSEFDDFFEFLTLISVMDDKWMALMAARKPK